ncbi:MAG TPA: amidohydrolase family protein [Planctomycetota bacterium]|nr:amidohydrolase family protein [Planctomycetota bacterium]
MAACSRRVRLACLALAAASTPAQDLLPKAPPQAAPVVLKNAVLHTVSDGIVLGGTLWFQDGVIRGVLPAGSEPNLPAGVQPVVFDLAGKHVFPGMISAHTSLGLVEIGSVRQTVDTDELGELSPEALAIVAVNPDSAAIPVARSNGVLAAAVFPSGGLLPGRVSVMQLDGWTNADMTVQADAGPVVDWPQQRRNDGRRGRRGPRPDADSERNGEATARARQRIDDAFEAARAWLDAHAADASVPLDIRHAALAPALRGEVPVFVLAEELEQIESAVLWATGRKLRPVIVGGRDAPLCAELLHERHVPVVIDGVHRLPRRDDSAYDEAFTLPKQLADLGVAFCIATGSDFSQDRNLPYHAATAAAFGLDRQQAFAAITLRAAEILGVQAHLGSLTAGKDATLFVADGHPFDLPTRIELAFVEGRQVDLRNKQTELARKYRERYRQQRGK